MSHWLSCLLFLAGVAAAQVQEIKVGIYSIQPPSSLTVTPRNGSVRWKSCLTCRETKLAGNLQIDATEGRLRLAGRTQTEAQVLITGNYRLAGSQHAPFQASFPLEIRARSNSLLLTLTLPLEGYVAAVLAAESGNQQSDESLRAMAVAVRTFAVHFRGRHKMEGFDFCDTTHCQDFRFSAVNDGIQAAVEGTEGELLWYQGQTAATYYHQSCGGNTADVVDVWGGKKVPYLREHTDPYCSRSKGGAWQSTISKADLGKALDTAGLPRPRVWTGLEIESRAPAGRVRTLRFVSDGADSNRDIAASSLRFAVGRALGWNQIRSDVYDVRDSGSEIIFTGRGSGHGVGLCQSGAEEMGRQGKGYREILAFYYPGTTLGMTAQGLSWQWQSGERIELLTTHANEDSQLIPAGEKAMSEAESATGLKFDFRPRLKVFPTIDTYRDSTGESGWVAASTRGHTIRLQPVALLRSRRALDSTLRHEFMHLLVESHARPGLPLWFREGVVLYLANPADSTAANPASSKQDLDQMLLRSADRREMEQAYAAARARVAELVQQSGQQTVMQWISSREGAPF